MTVLAVNILRFVHRFRSHYRPERHYMRGQLVPIVNPAERKRRR